MLGIRIFVRVQSFRRTPFAQLLPPCKCHVLSCAETLSGQLTRLFPYLRRDHTFFFSNFSFAKPKTRSIFRLVGKHLNVQERRNQISLKRSSFDFVFLGGTCVAQVDETDHLLHCDVCIAEGKLLVGQQPT